MAQTTGALPESLSLVEVSGDNVTWTDISGQINSVTSSGGEQLVGEAHTHDGDHPVVVASGKKGSRTLTFIIIYTETSNEAFDYITDIWETAGASTVYIRVSQGGGDSGDFIYTAANDAGTTSSVPIVQSPFADSTDAGGVMMATFTVIAPKWLRSTVA